MGPAVGQALEFLSQVLSQRGPDAVPYAEGVKYNIREHVSELLKVSEALRLAGWAWGRQCHCRGGEGRCMHAHTCTCMHRSPSHPAHFIPHHASTQMFPNLSIRVSEFHTNEGRIHNLLKAEGTIPIHYQVRVCAATAAVFRSSTNRQEQQRQQQVVHQD